jgi:solute carrier family 25 oxoglutarate transporter 11
LDSEEEEVLPLPNLVQQQGYNPFKILRQIHSTGAGLSAVFEGFDAHLYGRLTYLVVRNSIYSLIYNQVKPIKPYNDLSYREKSLIGSFAGAIGAVISHPFNVISIRQILDGQIKSEWRRNYSSSVSEAFGQLRASGETFQGLKVNVLRHIAYNATITGPYDYFKEGFFTRFGEYGFVEPLALLLASGVAAAVTLPFDNIRTRWVQLHKQPERNRINFASIGQAISTAVKVETHPLSLWAGFFTFFPQVFIYAYLTVGITNAFTESWKRKEGLLEWQI